MGKTELAAQTGTDRSELLNILLCVILRLCYNMMKKDT